MNNLDIDEMSSMIVTPSSIHDGVGEENRTNPTELTVLRCQVRYANGTRYMACPNNDFWTEEYYIVHTYLFLSCLGIVNNTLSLIFFYQPQFKGRVLPRMLRYYYISNLVGSLAFPFTFVYRDLISFCVRYSTAIFSIGIMTYISVLRYIRVRPSISPAGFTKRDIFILICLILFTCAFGSLGYYFFSKRNDNNQSINQAIIGIVIYYTIYIFLMALVALTFNTLTLWTKWGRQRSITSGSNSRTSHITLHTLTKYIIISSVFNAVTSLPHCVFKLYRMLQRGKPKSCDTCEFLVIWDTRLIVLYFMNLYLDNTLYLILSKEYRHDLFLVIKRICLKPVPKVIIREFTPTFAQSQNMTNTSLNIDREADENKL